MALNLQPIYSVNTPPLYPERFQGMIISLMMRQYRFCAFEPLAGEPLECGVFVTMTSNTTLGFETVSKPTVAGAKIFGASLLNFQRVLNWDATQKVFSYPQGTIVSLLEEGDMVMYAERPAEIGDPVHNRYAADGAFTRLGALSNAPGAGLDPVPGAKFLERVTSPGLVRVSLPDII